jgi:hypothetical protein
MKEFTTTPAFHSPNLLRYNLKKIMWCLWQYMLNMKMSINFGKTGRYFKSRLKGQLFAHHSSPYLLVDNYMNILFYHTCISYSCGWTKMPKYIVFFFFVFLLLISVQFCQTTPFSRPLYSFYLVYVSKGAIRKFNSFNILI